MNENNKAKYKDNNDTHEQLTLIIRNLNRRDTIEFLFFLCSSTIDKFKRLSTKSKLMMIGISALIVVASISIILMFVILEKEVLPSKNETRYPIFSQTISPSYVQTNIPSINQTVSSSFFPTPFSSNDLTKATNSPSVHQLNHSTGLPSFIQAISLSSQPSQEISYLPSQEPTREITNIPTTSKSSTIAPTKTETFGPTENIICAIENEPSLHCGANQGLEKCCLGLVCRLGICALLSNNPSIHLSAYPTTLFLNNQSVSPSNNQRVSPTFFPTLFQLNNSSNPSNVPLVLTISPSYQPSQQISHEPSQKTTEVITDIPTKITIVPTNICAIENEPSLFCGAIEGSENCCSGLVCHNYQFWRCVKEENIECAGPGTVSKQCGSKWGQAVPECCSGLVCEDKKCIPP